MSGPGETSDRVHAVNDESGSGGTGGRLPPYDLRSGKGRKGDLGTEGRLVQDDKGERHSGRGTTVVFSGVDAKEEDVSHDASTGERGRPRDRVSRHANLEEQGHLHRSSSAGSEFSSAPGSPTPRRRDSPSPPRTQMAADSARERNGLRDSAAVFSRGAGLFIPSRRSPIRRILSSGYEPPASNHRHRSPPIFAEMTWADLDIYRRIHLAVQQNQPSSRTVSSRVYEPVIRPDSPPLLDGGATAKPLAHGKSRDFGNTGTRQPGGNSDYVTSECRRRSSDSSGSTAFTKTAEARSQALGPGRRSLSAGPPRDRGG